MGFCSAAPSFAECIETKVFRIFACFCGTHFCSGRVLFTMVLVCGPVFPQGETLGPRVSSFLPLNNQNQITMDPSCTELASLSALAHSNIRMKLSGSARTSPFICFSPHQYPNSSKDGSQLDRTTPLFALGHSNIETEVSKSLRTSPCICFGAHQYPNSSMSNVLTQYLTLAGTLLHNTFSDSTAKRRMGFEKLKRGGGGGNKQWGNTASAPQLWYFFKGGQRQKLLLFGFFLRNSFLRRAQSQKANIFFAFFCAKQ